MTVYLVTGATRGIGAELVQQILREEDSLVIAGVRNISAPAAQKLTDLGTRVAVVQIDAEKDNDSEMAVKQLEAQGITQVDTIIANAGVAPDWCPAKDVKAEDLRNTLNVNVIGPLLLFQAFLPLLKKSTSPKIAFMSSAAGSLGVQAMIPFKSTVYGTSKAALNMLSVRIALEHPDIASFAMHPGLVKSDMADSAQGSVTDAELVARLDGELQPVEDATERILKLIRQAKPETHSGKFWSTVDGSEVPW